MSYCINQGKLCGSFFCALHMANNKILSGREKGNRILPQIHLGVVFLLFFLDACQCRCGSPYVDNPKMPQYFAHKTKAYKFSHLCVPVISMKTKCASFTFHGFSHFIRWNGFSASRTLCTFILATALFETAGQIACRYALGTTVLWSWEWRHEKALQTNAKWFGL